MFHLHTALAIQLLTLIAAAALLAWSGSTHVHAKKLVRAVSYSVIVVSILSVLCTTYYGAKYSRAGHFETPASMHGMMMKKKGSKDGSMMEGMMGEGMGKGDINNTPGSDEQEHSHDHKD
jgi:hypothetical protein